MSVPPPSERLPGASASVQFGRAMRRYFVTGLATLFPVVVTLFIAWQIFKIADGMLGQYLGWSIPGLGLVVTLLVIVLVGVFSVHFFGRVVFQTFETILSRLPFVRKIFPAVKQLTNFLFSEKGRTPAFRRVVLVQYPRPGAYSLAFVTNECVTMATGKEETLLTLLIPNPPSPFTGPIIFVPKRDVAVLELSVEEAVKLIVSGGVVGAPLQAVQPIA